MTYWQNVNVNMQNIKLQNMISYVFISDKNMIEDLVLPDYSTLEGVFLLYCSYRNLPQI